MKKIKKDLINFPSKEVPIPDTLDEKIDDLIRALPSKPQLPIANWAKSSVAGIAIFISVFCFLVITFPGFAAFASEVPGLNGVVALLTGDTGIQNALEKGYTKLQPISVDKDGYTLTLDNIVLDGNRLYFDSILSGNTVKEFIEKHPDGYVYQSSVCFPTDNKIDTTATITDFSLNYSCSTIGLNAGIINFGLNVEGDTLIKTHDITFNLDTIDDYIASSPDGFVIENEIVKTKYFGEEYKLREETTIEMPKITIPINKELLTQYYGYTQNEVAKFQLGRVILQKLFVFPTRLALCLDVQMEEGYFDTGFINPRIEDENGIEYKSEGLISMGGSGKKTMYFVPSVYFDKKNTNLYFCYDGIQYGEEKGKNFSLSLDENFPKEFTYMGQSITVSDFSYNNNLLSLTVMYGKLDDFEIQNIEILNVKPSSTSWGTIVNENNNNELTITYEDVTLQDIYDFEIYYPKMNLYSLGRIPVHREK